MVHSDIVDTNVQDENIEQVSSNSIDPSEQRLEKALNSIEALLLEQSNQLNTQSHLQNKDIVIANLDILISRVQDTLLQFNIVE